MRTPNLFIVGAPKCGTTAMHSYLAQHPDIFMSTRKEPHYFGTELSPLAPRRTRTLEECLSYFEDATDEKRVGESSPSYLYSSSAPDEIQAFCAEALIVVMLRNPADMMRSMHTQRVIAGTENVLNFERAIALDPEREAGRSLPPRAGPLGTLSYRQRASYAPFVRRYVETFGRARVLVIIYEEWAADVRAHLRRTFEFLGVDSSLAVADLPVVNPSRAVRSPVVHQLLHDPPGWAAAPLRVLVPRRLRELAFDRIRSANLGPDAPPPMRPELRRRLEQEMAPQVRALEEVLGRELPAWTRR